MVLAIERTTIIGSGTCNQGPVFTNELTGPIHAKNEFFQSHALDQCAGVLVLKRTLHDEIATPAIYRYLQLPDEPL
jgi:hypothetical protein